MEALCDIQEKMDFLQEKVRARAGPGFHDLAKSFKKNAVVAWLLCSTNPGHREECEIFFANLTR